MRKGIILMALLLTMVADTTRVNAQTDNWQLVFSDEFNGKNGSQPDTTKWNQPQRGTATWSRWIKNTPKTVYIKNGALVCRAIPNRSEPTDTARMLTGAIDTKGKFAFKYGKVEVRMRTNIKVGNFPAAWLVRIPGDKDSRYAEIDIVEMFGNEKRSVHTVHSDRSFRLKKEGIKRDTRIDVDVRKWHVYGIEWDSQKIVWTVDGREVLTYERMDTEQMQEEGQWTFDRELYLILNQSVGAGGHPLLVPNIKKKYETQFDWIRVYQRQ